MEREPGHHEWWDSGSAFQLRDPLGYSVEVAGLQPEPGEEHRMVVAAPHMYVPAIPGPALLQRGDRRAKIALPHRQPGPAGWSMKKFVRTARRYRTIQLQAGTRTLTAADPLPGDLRSALATIYGRAGDAH